jgi:hypothetical protein
VIKSSPDPDADQLVPGRAEDVGLGVDCSLKEGEEEVGDRLDGSDDEGFSATVDSGKEREGAVLALREVGGAQEGGELGQQGVGVVGARSDLQTVDLRAWDFDRDDALQLEVEVDGGSHGNLLLQGDLNLQSDGGSGVDYDGERCHGDDIQGDRFRAVRTEAVLQLGGGSLELNLDVLGADGGHEEGECEELHGGGFF